MGPLFNEHNAPPHNPHKPSFWNLQFSYYQYQHLLSWCSFLATTYEAFAIQSEVILRQVLNFLCLPSLEQWVLYSEHDDIIHCVIVLWLENFLDNWRPWHPRLNSQLASMLTSIEVLQLGFMSEGKLPTEILFFVPPLRPLSCLAFKHWGSTIIYLSHWNLYLKYSVYHTVTLWGWIVTAFPVSRTRLWCDSWSWSMKDLT